LTPHRVVPGRGSVTVLSVAVLAVAASCTVGVGVVARGLGDAARASSAADAAALAGVAGGRAAAEEVARANGASLVDFATRGIVAEVRVRFGRADATAAAAPASIH